MVHTFFETFHALVKGLSAPPGGSKRRSTTVSTKR